jgi:hypothetical protein
MIKEPGYFPGPLVFYDVRGLFQGSFNRRQTIAAFERRNTF